MKLLYKIPLLALGLTSMFVSCQQDATSDIGNTAKFRIKASTEDTSRTYLDADNKVLWHQDDQIIVAAFKSGSGGIAQLMSLVSGADTRDAIFEGDIVKADYNLFFALYPASALVNWNTVYEPIITLPRNVVATEKNIAIDTNPMVAASDNADVMKFYHICGILELQLTGSGDITSIQVVSGDGKPLAGYFKTSMRTGSLTPEYDVTLTSDYDTAQQYIYATLDTPLTLSATPRSVYVVVPPETYSGLEVRTFDADGNVDIRKATRDITVKRATITPVSSFTHTSATVPVATMYYNPEYSNWKYSCLSVRVNEAAANCKYKGMLYSYYETLIGQGKTDADIIADGKTYSGKSGMIRDLTLLRNTKYIYMALPYDSEGNAGALCKCVFTTKDIEYDATLSSGLSLSELSVTENAVSAQLSCAGAKAFLVEVMEDETYNQYAAAPYDFPTAVFSNMPWLSTGVSTKWSNGYLLTPSTKYHLVYAASNGIMGGSYGSAGSTYYTKYSQIRTIEFTTPAHTPSAATVQLTVDNITDFTASISVTPSSDATAYSYRLENKALSADEVGRFSTKVTDLTAPVKLSFENLQPSTDYVVSCVAYDGADSYGAVTTLSFSTAALTPVSDPEYDKFLGTYTMTYNDTSGNVGSRDIVISKAVSGKTFNIDGLISPTIVAQYGMANTIEATFLNGEIRITSQTIVAGGTYPYTYVNVCACNDAYSWYAPNTVLQTSAYNNGVVTPRATDSTGIEWTGFIFYGANSTGYGTFIDRLLNIVFTKK